MTIRLTVITAFIASAAFGMTSCNQAPDITDRTDAVAAEIFHGQPKKASAFYYSAVSTAGEWFKDTSGQGVHRESFQEFGPEGFLTSKTDRDFIGGDASTSLFEYVPGTHRKATGAWSVDSMPPIRDTYRYDDNDHLVEIRSHCEGQTVGRTENEVSRRGYIKESKRYNGNGVLKVRETRAYNRNGEMTQREVFLYGDSAPSSSTDRYTYQGNGLVASVTTQNELGAPKENRTTFTYEYDSHGNWIRRIAYNETAKTGVITERQIEYYPSEN